MATHSSTCLENSMNRGAWWATAHGVAKGRTRLSTFFQVSVRVRLRVRVRVRVGGGRHCAERWWLPGRGWVQVGGTG